MAQHAQALKQAAADEELLGAWQKGRRRQLEVVAQQDAAATGAERQRHQHRGLRGLSRLVHHLIPQISFMIFFIFSVFSMHVSYIKDRLIIPGV